MKTTSLGPWQFGVPIIVAPMAGGPSTAQLIIAAAHAGALGTLGGAYQSPADLEASIVEVQNKMTLPFGVNLFSPIPEPSMTEAQIEKALQATAQYRKELQLPNPVVKAPFHQDFDAQFAVILKTKPAFFSFIFGSIGKERIRQCQEAGIFVLGTATNLKEALLLQKDGVNAIIAQGDEAGGHRGFFDPNENPLPLGIRPLLKELSSRIHVPIIAAGGIMTAADISEMLSLGATAVQMGTAFLVTQEAGTSAPYRKVLLAKEKPKTQLTRAFSGRWARGLENRFLLEMKNSEALLPFPAQNAFTRDLRNASQKKDSADFISLWAGTGVDKVRATSVTELINDLKAGLQKN